MSTAFKFFPNYTVADYQSWQGDWELLDGFAIAMGPSPFGRHQDLQAAFIEIIRPQLRAFKNEFHVLSEIDWIITENTVVRPDLVVLSGGIPEKHVESTPELVIEILSDSTAAKDRVYKKQLYQEQKVPYYLIADVQARAIELYRLSSDQYQAVPIKETLTISLDSESEIQIKPSHLFR